MIHPLRDRFQVAVLWAGLLALPSITACEETAGVCVPGSTQSCVCPAGEGAQSCNAEGTGFDACVCSGGGGESGEPVEGSGVTLGFDPEDCDASEAYAAKGCFEDTVFWLDGCGGKTEPIDACEVPQEVCDAGACVVVCPTKSYLDCEGGHVWWFDACGYPEEQEEACIGNTICSAGECVEACEPHAYKDCHKDDVWWFDACDHPESVAEGCSDAQFCTNKACVKAIFNGDYTVSADPNQKTFSLGTATFNPMTVALSVSGANVTAEGNAFGTPVTWSGTIEGKHMTLTGTYDDPGGSSHQEQWDVDFVAYDSFEGVLNDNVTVMGFPGGNLLWNIEGIKE